MLDIDSLDHFAQNSVIPLHRRGNNESGCENLVLPRPFRPCSCVECMNPFSSAPHLQPKPGHIIEPTETNATPDAARTMIRTNNVARVLRTWMSRNFPGGVDCSRLQLGATHLLFGPFLFLLLHPGLPFPLDDVSSVFFGLLPDGRHYPAHVFAPRQTLDPRSGEF